MLLGCYLVPRAQQRIIKKDTTTTRNVSFIFSRNIEAKFNVNNLTNKQYFTKRPTFYPGPGVWPSDGRNFGTTFIIRL